MNDKRLPLGTGSTNGHTDLLEVIDGVQQRIGQDLHDSIQQDLVGLGFISQTLLSKLQAETQNTSSESLDSCRELAEKLVQGFSRALEELHCISRGLVPGARPIDQLIDSLRELAFRTNDMRGIRCTFKCYRNAHAPIANISFQLYRIAQEALSNAMKHSGANHILIGIECKQNKTVLKIADNGNGFHSGQVCNGLGFQSMQDRAKRIGATLEITSIPTRGTLVRCTAIHPGNQSHGENGDE